MFSITFKKRFLSSTLLLAAVCASQLFCARNVMASCGSYLHTRNSHQQPMQLAHSLADRIETAVGGQEEAIHPRDQESLPCSGPGCRQKGPSDSLPVAPPLNSRLIDDRAVSGCEASLSACKESAAAVPASEKNPGRGFPPLIEVPPERHA